MRKQVYVYAIFRWLPSEKWPTLVCMYDIKPSILGQGQFAVKVVKRV